MFCTKCGKELDNEAIVCVGCGCKVEPFKEGNIGSGNSSDRITLARVFIIIGMVLMAFFIVPIVIGVFALRNLKTATCRKDVTTWGVLALVFCGAVGGIIMLTLVDEDFK